MSEQTHWAQNEPNNHIGIFILLFSRSFKEWKCWQMCWVLEQMRWAQNEPNNQLGILIVLLSWHISALNSLMTLRWFIVVSLVKELLTINSPLGSFPRIASIQSALRDHTNSTNMYGSHSVHIGRVAFHNLYRYGKKSSKRVCIWLVMRGLGHGVGIVIWEGMGICIKQVKVLELVLYNLTNMSTSSI